MAIVIEATSIVRSHRVPWAEFESITSDRELYRAFAIVSARAVRSFEFASSAGRKTRVGRVAMAKTARSFCGRRRSARETGVAGRPEWKGPSRFVCIRENPDLRMSAALARCQDEAVPSGNVLGEDGWNGGADGRMHARWEFEASPVGRVQCTKVPTLSRQVSVVVSGAETPVGGDQSLRQLHTDSFPRLSSNIRSEAWTPSRTNPGE